MTRYFLKTLFRDTTRQTDWTLEIFLISNIRYKYLYSYFLVSVWHLCRSTAAKEILHLLFFFKLKNLHFFNTDAFSTQDCGLIYTNQRKQTTEHKTFSSFWKTNLFFVDKLSKLILPIVFSYLVLLHELPVYILYQSKWAFRLILKLSSD